MIRCSRLWRECGISETLHFSLTLAYRYPDGRKIRLRTTQAIVRHSHIQLIESFENIAYLTLYGKNVFSPPANIHIIYIPLSWMARRQSHQESLTFRSQWLMALLGYNRWMFDTRIPRPGCESRTARNLRRVLRRLKMTTVTGNVVTLDRAN